MRVRNSKPNWIKMELGNDWSEPGAIALIKSEAERLLSDPKFARSPTLSRLLSFLVEKTASGEPVKSYTIAIDGLGRSEGFDGDPDTYARVTVTRLRKVLAQHYESQPSDRQIYIDTGTYEVRLSCRNLEKVDEDRQETSANAVESRPIARWAIWGGIVAFLTLLIAVIYLKSRSDDSWAATELPTIAVTATSASAGDRVSIWRTELASDLSTYLGTKVEESGRDGADFEVIVSKVSDDKSSLSVRVVHTRSDQIIWTAQTHSPGAANKFDPLSIVAAEIAAPGGAINAYLRRRPSNPQSPRGCWLQFTKGVQTYNTLSDATLSNCARTWYQVQPERPLAAMLYAWTLTDRSVFQLSERRKQETLGRAIKILRNSATLNPDMAALQIALMRAYSFRGQGDLAVQAARDALQSDEENRLVAGMAGAGMVFWNDPEGERLLRQLAGQGDDVDFAWEHVGLFVAAMMRDDVAEARLHELHLQRYQTGQPLLLLLEAALARREGDISGSDQILKSLRSDARISVTGVESLVKKLPFSAAVKARLLEWLTYDQIPAALGERGGVKPYH